MSTTEAAGQADRARNRAPASRIVRIGVTGPLIVATTILATVALAVPHEAWIPWHTGSAPTASWELEPPRVIDAIATLQVVLGRWSWRADVVTGAIGVAALCAAIAWALLAMLLRRTGLSTALSALLALVAAAAPFAGWSGSSPLGVAPVSLLGAVLLALMVYARGADGTGSASPPPTSPRQKALLALVLAILAAVSEAVARSRHASTLAVTTTLVRADLGPIGLVLLAASASTVVRSVAQARVWLGAAALWLLTTTAPAELRAALLLPAAWWLVGTGLGNLLVLRGGAAPRWAGVGLLAWLALHTAARPWGAERQQTALVGTWARGMADHFTDTHPVVADSSPRGRLLSAMVTQNGRGRWPSPAIDRDAAPGATNTGRRPVVLSASQLETLRWSGVAFAPWQAETSTALEDLLDALPAGTVTLAVISADASSRLSPRQWQALGRAGLRLADAAGTARAHALVGITGARVQTIEVAQTGGVRLDVQPGDVLGRTAARSPVDARLEANQSRVSVWLRGESLLDHVEGLALVFFTTRGDLLGWRAGRSPAHVDGPALGRSRPTRAVAMAALPCLDVAAGRDRDLSALTHLGALGLTWAGPGRLDLTLERPHGWTEPGVRLAGSVPLTAGTVLVDSVTRPGAFTVRGNGGQSAGVYLRGPVSTARAITDHGARVCAAWPMALALDPGSGPIEMMVAPRHEAHFGYGWHELEVQPGAGYFRWTSGPRATVLIALQHAAPFTFALDAQAPAAPRAGDEVRLSVGDHDLGALPLLPTRGMYTWNVPADAVREGMNSFTLHTTRTVRPADRQSGADARQLGLLVRGWIVGPAS